MVVGKMGEVLFPAISNLQGRGDDAGLARLFTRTSWFLCVFMVGIQGAIFVFAGDILRLYVGPKFSGDSVQVLRIFAFTAILSCPAMGVEQYLLGTGKTVWTAVTCIITGILTVLVSILLIPRFGLAGAAWSDLVAIVLSRPLIHWAIWRQSLRKHVGLGEFLGFLYGPSVIGLLLVSLAWFAYRHSSWCLNLPELLAAFTSLSCALVGLMIFLDFLPQRRQRRRDFGELLSRAWCTVMARG
jgi:O-antigen/teichoic acid export membrane protein